MAAQRAAGEMDFATLNEQLRLSALRPACRLPQMPHWWR
jgi:hypothetical protein